MPEESDKYIRVPVPGEEGKHSGHKIRTIVVSAPKGIKALYCIDCKKIITYIFAKSKDWTMAKAKAWVKDHTKSLKSLSEIHVDQEKEFFKIIAVIDEGETEEYIPNSPSFELTKEMETETTGLEDKERGQGQGTGGQRQGDGGADNCVCPECGEEVPHERGTPCNKKKCPKCGASMVGKSAKGEEVEAQFVEMELAKVDKAKRLVYGVFLVPEKADHDGDVISVEDVEKVAHLFVAEYRTIDEMHKDIIRADIVESAIAWKDDLDFQGKVLKKGTWFGAVKIHDKDVWEKVLDGTYKGFSVRIAGARELIVE